MSLRRLRKRIALKCVQHVQHDYFAYSTNEIIVLWRCLCLSSAISLHCLSSLSRWFSASFFQVTRSSLCVMGISFLLIVSGLKILRGTQFPLRAHSQSFMVHLHLEFYQALSSSMLHSIGESCFTKFSSLEFVHRLINFNFRGTVCIWKFKPDIRVYEDILGEESVLEEQHSLLDHNLASLSLHFFRDLKKRCFPSATANAICCYELMCVHVGLVPVQFAAKHIRSLAAALFQTSLGAHHPISLMLVT